jgi:RNA recognition motif-containing protein
VEIYVGSLPWSTDEQELKKLFSEFGEVTKVFIPWDRANERGRGYGFVTMPDPEAAAKAIGGLDETVFRGRTLRVSKSLNPSRN